ncbi:hypothetical protein T439DRAFT_380880 [Meredithblackwellia eburnea MCA 4105]
MDGSLAGNLFPATDSIKPSSSLQVPSAGANTRPTAQMCLHSGGFCSHDPECTCPCPSCQNQRRRNKEIGNRETVSFYGRHARAKGLARKETQANRHLKKSEVRRQPMEEPLVSMDQPRNETPVPLPAPRVRHPLQTHDSISQCSCGGQRSLGGCSNFNCSEGRTALSELGSHRQPGPQVASPVIPFTNPHVTPNHDSNTHCFICGNHCEDVLCDNCGTLSLAKALTPGQRERRAKLLDPESMAPRRSRVLVFKHYKY